MSCTHTKHGYDARFENISLSKGFSSLAMKRAGKLKLPALFVKVVYSSFRKSTETLI